MIPEVRAFNAKQHVVLSVLLSTKLLTLENTKGAIKKGQSREIGSIDETKKNKAKTQHNMCWTLLYTNKHK
jgi:hypothetical protein